MKATTCPVITNDTSSNNIYTLVRKNSFAIALWIEDKYFSRIEDPASQMALGEGRQWGGKGLSANNNAIDRHTIQGSAQSSTALVDGHVESGKHVIYLDSQSGPYYRD